MARKKEWVEWGMKLEKGDQVMVRERMTWRDDEMKPVSMATVTHATKTRVTVVGPRWDEESKTFSAQFYRAEGTVYSASYGNHGTEIVPPSPNWKSEWAEEVRERRARIEFNEVTRIAAQRLPTDKLIEAAAYLRQLVEDSQ